jgi:hypothetical protein
MQVGGDLGTSMTLMADILAKVHGEIWMNHDKPQREVDLVVTRPFAIPPPEDHFQGELLFAESLFVIGSGIPGRGGAG